MRKSLLLLSAALMLSGSAFARQWDFSKWSSATYGNLMAGAFENCNTINPTSGWSDVEKKDGTAPTAESKAKCFWEVTQQGTADGATLVANGVAIAELDGLKWVHTDAPRNLAIAVDYPSTSFGSYHGASYLWLGGSKKCYFYIPNVALGTNITIGVESHKSAEGRGIELYAGSGHNTSGKKLMDADGNNVAVPTVYEDQTWRVPEDLTEGLNEDGTVDVLIYNTNGCHIYYIKVDEGDEVINTEDIKVAYLYDGEYATYKNNGGIEADYVLAGALSAFNVTTIDYSAVTESSEAFNESLLEYDVVVLSEAVASGNSLAKGVYQIINKVPVLNLKSFFYKKGVWGVGEGKNPGAKAESIKVVADYADDALFADVDMDEDGVVSLYNVEDISTISTNLVQGCTVNADGLFGSDDVIATVGTEGYTAIHAHGTKNKYMLIALSSDYYSLLNDNAFMLINNAVKLLYKTKSAVQKAGAPVVTEERNDNATTVTLTTSAKDATIYYALGEGEYKVYTEPFVVTENGTVIKAYAVAHGYDDSDVTTATISVFGKTADPVITVNGNIVTIAGEGSIYYNYNGITVADRSTEYTAAITVPENATIYAFAVATDKLQSELVKADVTVYDLKQDTLSHFNAGETDWYANAVIYFAGEEQPTPTSNWAAKAAYYFGKNGWAGNVADHEEVVKDEQGNPLKSLVDPTQDSVVVVYKANPEAVKTACSTSDKDWYLYSRGQSITGETNLAPENGVGNGAGSRYAETADDLIGTPTKGCITFGGKANGETWTAAVMSVNKFQAPFDVVTYLGNGNGSGTPVVVAEVSADGENWTKIGTLQASATQRYFKKSRIAYNGTDQVYVRIAHESGSNKGQLYDVIILSGNAPVVSGIESLSETKVVKNQFTFDLHGRRVSAKVAGKLYIENGKKVLVR